VNPALAATLRRRRSGSFAPSEAAVGLAVERVYDAMRRRRMT
jgi:hypothetical protein